MNKIIFSLSVFAFLALAGSALANTYGGYGSPCQPIYGGGETCISVGNLLLNKTVQNPQSKEFVDNLSLSNDPKFAPDQKLEFRISVTNTGNSEIGSVTITDILPNYLTFSSGQGNYDKNSKTLTFTIFNLKANETRVFNIEAKVVSASSLPKDKAVNCVVNQAKAASGSNSSSDISQVCIQSIQLTKGGLPVYPAPVMKQTPATGAEMFSLFALIPAAGAGLFLRKKVSNSI